MIRSTTRYFSLLAVVALALSASWPAQAAKEAVPPPDMDWPHEGLFSTYDRAALQRGFQVYKQVCAACHSMNKLYYRHLEQIGYTEGQVKTVAAEYMVTDGPDGEGQMFERPALPSDKFWAPFANKQAAMYANNGAYPPDLSLITKARYGGEDYIYGLLIGYEDPPADKADDLLPGQYWNRYMPGHVIAMAPPLMDGQVDYVDENVPETVKQYAQDLSQFLAWAAEPHMEARKRAGIKAFIFLFVFTLLMYQVKKRIWKDVKSK